MSGKYITAEEVLKTQNSLWREVNAFECEISTIERVSFYQEGIRAMADAIVAMIEGKEDE